MLGRRGPMQAAFTNPELRELAELGLADVIVDPVKWNSTPTAPGIRVSTSTASTMSKRWPSYAAKSRPESVEDRPAVLASPVAIEGERA